MTGDDFVLVCGDAESTLRELPSESVHCCVTSPPYYNLRDYKVGGQVGMEATPEKYVQRLVSVFAELKRVLREDGTLWVVLGDSYAAKKSGSSGTFKPKDLMGIPWRTALALQADGWYLRQDIIWFKGNPLPESVQDRCTRSHEYIFMLSKAERYFYDAEAIKEPAVSSHSSGNKERKVAVEGERSRINSHLGSSIPWAPGGPSRSSHDSFKRSSSKRGIPQLGHRVGTHRPDRAENTYDTALRNKRDVWLVNVKPYKGAHFAVYPEALVVPCIKAGSPEAGLCPKCGKVWVRIVETEKFNLSNAALAGNTHCGGKGCYTSQARKNHDIRNGPVVLSRTQGFHPQCACAVDPVPAVVLDPFSGSGTTGVVALGLGRQYIGIDLNQEYIDLSRDRILKSLDRGKGSP